MYTSLLLFLPISINSFEYSPYSIHVENNKSIRVPVDQSNTHVTKQLKEKIEKGIYKEEDLIVPQEFKKITINQGKIATENVCISGRKIPLKEFRNELLDRNRKYMRLTTDEELNNLTEKDFVKYLDINEYNFTNYDAEKLKQKMKAFQRTMYLMMWHDCSAIGGHSYLLMMVAFMYDPACYFTDIEFHQKCNELVNIQAFVETPMIYILARCPSNDQQHLYSEERLDDILMLNENMKTTNNIDIIGKLRIFYQIFKKLGLDRISVFRGGL